MQLEIITPDKNIFNGEAEAVQLPGKDGLFQLLDRHAPIISSLAKGVIKINLKNSFAELNADEDIKVLLTPDEKDDKVAYYEVNGGVIEMLNNKVIVLAD